MASSRKLNETRTNAQKTGYAIIIRGLQVDTTISGGGIDGRLIAGGFEANSLGVTVGALYANGSLGTNNYVLRTNGANTFWGPAPAGGGGGGNTAGYLQVANAVATYQTIAIERAALANTNSYIATKVATTTFNSALANTNAYIATKLSSASAAATYQTIVVERAALANTNAFIKTKADWSSLISTNTALRTLISDRLQVANAAAIYQTKAIERAALANTNAYIATKATWAALTSTNTAIRTLVSDRLQVANAVATYQTIAIERAALANTNIAIATKASWSSLASTNTALRTLINDRLQVANAATTYQTIAIERAALANTNAYIATKLNTSTAASTYQTIVIERAALANTNSYIATKVDTSTFNAALANTNAYIATKIGSSNPATSGLFAHTGRATISTNLTVSGNTTSNKIIATNRFESRGNNVLGSAGKTQIVNGVLAANGNITVSTKLTATGNIASPRYVSVAVDSRAKYTVWDNDSYGIGFGSGYTFGPLNNYSMTFINDYVDTRGFWWGRTTHTGAQGSMALDLLGNLYVARKIRFGYGNSDTTDPASWNADLDLSGNMYVSGNTRVNALGVGTAAGTNGSIRATNDITAYYSDERLKTIIEVIPDPLDKVMSLRGFYFTPNETAQSLGYQFKKEVGVSAQEVQAILPEIVVPAPIDENYLTVKYEKLIPLLIEAIKELTIKVNALEARANVAI